MQLSPGDHTVSDLVFSLTLLGSDFFSVGFIVEPRLSPLADYDNCSLTAPAEIGSFYLMVGAEIPNLILLD